MNFEQTGPTAGDCMTPYKVTGEYPRVVRDFVEYVLKKFPEEWEHSISTLLWKRVFSTGQVPNIDMRNCSVNCLKNART